MKGENQGNKIFWVWVFCDCIWNLSTHCSLCLDLHAVFVLLFLFFLLVWLFYLFLGNLRLDFSLLAFSYLASKSKKVQSDTSATQGVEYLPSLIQECVLKEIIKFKCWKNGSKFKHVNHSRKSSQTPGCTAALLLRSETKGNSCGSRRQSKG